MERKDWKMSMKNHPNRKRIRRRETSKCNQISWPGENSSPWRFSQHLPASLIISQSHRGFSFQVAVHSQVQRAGVSCLEPGAQEMARLSKIFQTILILRESWQICLSMPKRNSVLRWRCRRPRAHPQPANQKGACNYIYIYIYLSIYVCIYTYVYIYIIKYIYMLVVVSFACNIFPAMQTNSIVFRDFSASQAASVSGCRTAAKGLVQQT